MCFSRERECVFSTSHDDNCSRGRGDLHERKKGKVLVHWSIVRNEEFQQFGPTEGERSEEWMSLFSSFSLSSGAPLCSVQRPIVAMSLSSPQPSPCCRGWYVAPAPVFHTSPLRPGPHVIDRDPFSPPFWKSAENLMN